jgi:hypothetical protein
MTPHKARGQRTPQTASAWQRRVAPPCHIVEPDQREELANSPPFETIARRSGLDAGMLAYLILSPHPRMNMTWRRSEAEDIAAYIATLRR